MFDGLKRKIVFGKIADALDGLRRRLLGQPSSGDGKTLGWDMDTWKKYLEGAGVTVLGGALGSLVDNLGTYINCLQAGATCNFSFKAIGASAAAGALAALMAWLRMSPGDPRRTPWDGVDRRQDQQPPKQ